MLSTDKKIKKGEAEILNFDKSESVDKMILPSINKNLRDKSPQKEKKMKNNLEKVVDQKINIIADDVSP